MTAKPPSWDKYAEQSSYFSEPLPALLLEVLKSEPRLQRIIDVGCGDGHLLAALREKVAPQVELLGADISAERLNRVVRHCPTAKVMQCGAEQILLPNGCMDLVTSSQVIEHVPEQKKMLAELARVCKPEGHLYLSTVFKKWYGWYFYRCNGRWVIDPTHLREYRHDDELIPDIEAAGFKILKVRKSGIIYAPVDFLLRRVRVKILKQILAPLRLVRLPIPGYYNWEILALRES